MWLERLEWFDPWLRVDVELAEVEDPLDQVRSGVRRGIFVRGCEDKKCIVWSHCIDLGEGREGQIVERPCSLKVGHEFG